MVKITGIDTNYFKVNQVEILKGHSLQESDIIHANNVVIISENTEKIIL